MLACINHAKSYSGIMIIITALTTTYRYAEASTESACKIPPESFKTIQILLDVMTAIIFMTECI